jgi:alpha-beta hydrolase superfamily lysophospholipase
MMPVPRWKVTLAGALNRLLPAIPFQSGLDVDHLSRDPHVVREYRDDPLVHSHLTPRLFSEASIAMGLVLQRSDRIRIPLMFILAGSDQIVSTPRSEAFARSLSARDVAIQVYPEAYHEVFNDLDRSLAISDLRDWIASRLAAAMPKRQQLSASALHRHPR